MPGQRPFARVDGHGKMIKKGGTIMGEECCGVKVGETIPDFRIETFEPEKGDFGEVSLGGLKERKKWTVLFFYPADFTFV
jgi:hypothetical protein